MKCVLKLYIAGRTPNAMKAINTLKGILETKFKNSYKLEVIDIVKNPMKAEKENIMVTPTLIKELPLPIRKIVGELVDREKVLVYLNMKENEKIEKKKTTKN